MLFRIEDSENEGGIHREYCIISQDLPIMQMSEIEGLVLCQDLVQIKMRGSAS